MTWTAVGAVGVVIVAGVVVKKHRDHVAADHRDQAAAEQVVTAWLAAVKTGDGTKAAALATPATAKAAATLVARVPKDLHSVRISVHQDSAVSRRTGADFSESVTLRGLGNVMWSGHIPLVKVDKTWRVPFTPAVVHPQLKTGQHLARTRQLGTRGRVLLADGTSMAMDPTLAHSVRGDVTTLTTAAQAAAVGPLAEVGDDAGTSGLEAAFQSTLAGNAGGSFAIVDDSSGKTLSVLKDFPQTDGKDVTTTLDERVQTLAQAAVVSGTGPVGGLVVLDTQTGALLAAADKGGYQRSLQGTYPPGSTYKIVTSMAALAHGVPAGTVMNCDKTIQVGGRTFKNAEDEQFGPITFTRAFAKSCNTWFVQIPTKVSLADLTAESRLFGFADSAAKAKNPLPIPSFGGSWPTATSVAGAAGQSIGQDGVLASPLQMASVAAAIGSGAWHSPHLTPDAKVTTNPLPLADVGALRAFMSAVVTGEGTAAGTGQPGGTIGKTGTAETNNPDPKATDAWFVAVHGRYTVACVYDEAGFGGDVAAPVVGRLLSQLG